jgi:hypothetical protein
MNFYQIIIFIFKQTAGGKSVCSPKTVKTHCNASLHNNNNKKLFNQLIYNKMTKLNLKQTVGANQRVSPMLMIAVLAISAVMVSCGGGNSNKQSGTETETKTETTKNSVEKSTATQAETAVQDQNLILADGQVWAQKDNYGNYSGYIFNSDGTYGYYWGKWTLTSSGTWSTSGNRITIIQTGISAQNYTYSVSGSAFTMKNAFGDEYVYQKMATPN